MVPAFFVELDDFPLTPNGKIDNKALPDPVKGIEATAKPANELERDILAVWSEVLGHDRIGINENFFEIGGDSLRVVRVQTQLETLLGRPYRRPNFSSTSPSKPWRRTWPATTRPARNSPPRAAAPPTTTTLPSSPWHAGSRAA